MPRASPTHGFEHCVRLIGDRRVLRHTAKVTAQFFGVGVRRQVHGAVQRRRPNASIVAAGHEFAFLYPAYSTGYCNVCLMIGREN